MFIGGKTNMEIEKEVRYKLEDKKIIEKIIDTTNLIEKRKKNADLVMGWSGFNSLDKYGFICRIRQKNNQIFLQSKKRINKYEWEEAKINLNSFKEGYQFLCLIGMKPYLYINREREIRRKGNLKIFIDEIELLGTYVEIELQESENPQKELSEFLKEVGIKDNKQKLYGDIFKEKIESNSEFKMQFENSLVKFLNS